MAWSPADIPSQAGRVAVVTGANDGLGPATATAARVAHPRIDLLVNNAGVMATPEGGGHLVDPGRPGRPGTDGAPRHRRQGPRAPDGFGADGAGGQVRGTVSTTADSRWT